MSEGDEDWREQARAVTRNQWFNLLVDWDWRRHQPATRETLWASPRVKNLPIHRDEIDTEVDLPADEPIWYTVNAPITDDMVADIARFHAKTAAEMVEAAEQMPDDRSWEETTYRIHVDSAFAEQTTIGSLDPAEDRPTKHRRAPADILVAVQDGTREIIDYDCTLLNEVESVTAVIGSDPEVLMDDADGIDRDGLWRLRGEVVYDRGGPDVRGRRQTEPRHIFDGEFYLILRGDAVTFH